MRLSLIFLLLLSLCFPYPLVMIQRVNHHTLTNIAPRMIVGLSGPLLSNQLTHLLDAGLAGILLMGNAWGDPIQTRSFIKNIKRKYPHLLVAVDQEGGRVMRVSHPNSGLPSAQTISNTYSKTDTYVLAKENARNLHYLGIDINFAPVLDVLTITGNRVIGSRSFGVDKRRVAELGVAYMNGLQSTHILPVIKHFPGHGDTQLDSHFSLPVNDHSMGHLESVSMYPFSYAIRLNAPAIMIAHIVYLEFDQYFPASLSKRWISYLRNTMQFNGIIFTDDLSMKAISHHYTLINAIELALDAGVDYVIVTDISPLF